jgi:hypothetical protein
LSILRLQGEARVCEKWALGQSRNGKYLLFPNSCGLKRHTAIDVPVAYAAGFENFVVLASQLLGFYDVEVNYKGPRADLPHLS